MSDERGHSGPPPPVVPSIPPSHAPPPATPLPPEPDSEDTAALEAAIVNLVREARAVATRAVPINSQVFPLFISAFENPPPAIEAYYTLGAGYLDRDGRWNRVERYGEPGNFTYDWLLSADPPAPGGPPLRAEITLTAAQLRALPETRLEIVAPVPGQAIRIRQVLIKKVGTASSTQALIFGTALNLAMVSTVGGLLPYNTGAFGGESVGYRAAVQFFPGSAFGLLFSEGAYDQVSYPEYRHLMWAGSGLVACATADSPEEWRESLGPLTGVSVRLRVDYTLEDIS